MEETSLMLGDPYGLYLEKGWHYLNRLNTIFIVEEDEAIFESALESLNHEYLHAVISRILNEQESLKANYGLDFLIFTLRKLTPDLLKEVKT